MPQHVTPLDQQRIDNLQQRFLYIQNRMEDIRKNKTMPNINTEHLIEKIDVLINHLREIEEQIRANAIQPISDYERLIPDCQV